jgi:hypothetical protein
LDYRERGKAGVEWCSRRAYSASPGVPKIRDWMNQRSWIVSEIVLLFFVVIIVNRLASA